MGQHGHSWASQEPLPEQLFSPWLVVPGRHSVYVCWVTVELSRLWDLNENAFKEVKLGNYCPAYKWHWDMDGTNLYKANLVAFESRSTHDQLPHTEENSFPQRFWFERDRLKIHLLYKALSDIFHLRMLPWEWNIAALKHESVITSACLSLAGCGDSPGSLPGFVVVVTVNLLAKSILSS